jgi:membrane protease YdiL (CAAX protease family)
VVVRSNLAVIGGAVLSGLAALLFFGASFAHESGGARAVEAVIAVTAAIATWRIARAGLRLEPQLVIVRGLTTTDQLARSDVLGLAIQPFAQGRLRRIAVVCVDGRVVPAVWTVSLTRTDEWDRRAAWAAHGFGSTQLEVSQTLESVDRLAGDAAVPFVTPDPVLSPATVSPADPADSASRWLGWETTFVIAAFALPGIAGAVEILAKHLGGVSDLNEFDLPLPHNPAASLPILVFGYLTTALVVPIALLLLARTGQLPARLGLERDGWRRDVASSAGLLAGVWVTLALLTLALTPLINNKHLTNTETNSHVPAYYIIYAVAVSATTAINEEVLVNGYFLTRLSQRGWSPWRALALSLAVRTSYHAYYGIGFILTVPLGYLVTRSFQKRQRLGRPILVHFTYDVILLIIAVLTS